MKTLLITSGIVLSCALGVTLVSAQLGESKRTGDARVERLLKSADLNYEIDQDGDFRLGNKFDSGRTHIIFVNSGTTRLGDMEIREVWSVGYVSKGTMPGDIAINLLKENARVKLGAWECRRINGKETAVFRAQIAADTDEETLLMTLQAVSQTADEKEEELTKKDDL